ncbi:MAG: hypothetical protein ACRCT2_01820 [Plesiomonas shigelloides]
MTIPTVEEFNAQLPKVRSPKPDSRPTTAPSTGDVLNGSLALLIQDASDDERETAYRTLVKMTGRSLNVSPIAVAFQVFPFVGLLSLILMLVRAISFSRGPSGLLFLKVMPIATAVAAFSLFAALIWFRRQPDVVFTIASAAVGCLISIALSSIL